MVDLLTLKVKAEEADSPELDFKFDFHMEPTADEMLLIFEDVITGVVKAHNQICDSLGREQLFPEVDE